MAVNWAKWLNASAQTWNWKKNTKTTTIRHSYGLMPDHLFQMASKTAHMRKPFHWSKRKTNAKHCARIFNTSLALVLHINKVAISMDSHKNHGIIIMHCIVSIFGSIFGSFIFSLPLSFSHSSVLRHSIYLFVTHTQFFFCSCFVFRLTIFTMTLFAFATHLHSMCTA